MPEIGDQLRETRLRARIDITEVEAATKIRAKYLRALENEEWELLPGPTFVKTFLRTYADYLGLDARNLVEEYRQRYERPSQHDLMPLRPGLAGRRGRRRCGVALAPWMVPAVGFLLLVGALYLLGTWGDGGEEPGADQARRSVTATPTATPTPQPRRRRAAAPKRVRLRIVASGPVSVCLEAANGTPLIPNVTMDAGQRSRVFRGKRFVASFGTGAAAMRVNGRSYDVSDNAPIGYEIRRKGPPRPLPESERPQCSG
jgi:cytoskeleton protein RodZ